jgi:hypothetical protein
MNEEYQRPIDDIAFVNGTDNTTIIDIFNKLPRMSLEHIASIRSIDENANMTFEQSMNDAFFGY